MARPWRVCFPEAVYHVTARGNNRQKIFLEDADRRAFLSILEKAVSRFDLCVMAFCLMPNHYHLCLRTPEPNLSRAMHWINSTYVAGFKRRHGLVGHLFQGRFKSVLVANERHWSHLTVYLHLNPVRARLAADPEDYEWSSFRDYVRGRSRYRWLQPEPALAGFGPRPRSARRLYREQCRLAAGHDRWQEFKKEVERSSRKALRELARDHAPKGQIRYVPEFRNAKRPSVDLEAELERMARAASIEPKAMFKKSAGLPFKLLAYYHLVRNLGFGMTQVGEIFGVSVHAVSKGLQRLEPMLSSDPKISRLLQEMSNVET